MDASSSGGPAPDPATWGLAPTWATPAPAPTTWAAPATWAAPSSVVPTDGCRAVWLPSVNESTFNAELCSLSGWWKAKLASHGTIDNHNSIDSTTTGYRQQTDANVGTPLDTSSFTQSPRLRMWMAIRLMTTTAFQGLLMI